MIHYRIDAARPQAHTFRVVLTIDAPAAEQRISLPVWIPGSYLVREFARHVSGLSARRGEREVGLTQLDKATWVARSQGDGPLVLEYGVYAYDTSVRAAYLDTDRGFFNSTSLCLRVEGQEERPHAIEIRDLPAGWRVATAMTAVAVDADGRGLYRSADYDELVDHPFELGTFWHGRFEAGGVAHEFVVAGAFPDFDGERLLADSARLCAAQIAFWHGSGGAAQRAPFERYVFMLNAVEDAHGGLEHRASTALIAPRRDLPRREPAPAENGEPGDGYVGVLGLISHEYFHTWNVKRMRPRDFTRFDYTRENYTELLWFFEGFTSYYDDLFVRRCGLIDESRYLKLVAKTVSNVLAVPGRRTQSLAQSSFDAWVKYYRTDENTPNATVSYYAKGSLVALALDLRLRAESTGSLDDVMRALWARGAGGPIDEGDIAAALEAVGGRAYASELADWVHGRGELPLREAVEAVGIEWQAVAPTLSQRLGLRVGESALTGIKVTHVLRDGAAEAAGFAPGDEILALAGWRVRRLDDALRVAAPGDQVQVLVARDQRVQTLRLEWPQAASAAGAVNLKPAAKPTPEALARQKAWLAG